MDEIVLRVSTTEGITEETDEDLPRMPLKQSVHVGEDYGGTKSMKD